MKISLTLHSECPSTSYGSLLQEWWNGRHGGLKIPWPLRLCGFESHFLYFKRLRFSAKPLLLTARIMQAVNFIKQSTARIRQSFRLNLHYENIKGDPCGGLNAIKDTGYEYQPLHYPIIRRAHLHSPFRTPRSSRTRRFPHELRRPNVGPRDNRRAACHAV